MTVVSRDLLDQLRNRAAAATPGPWFHVEANGGHEHYVYGEDLFPASRRKIAWCPNGDSSHDAEFIAAANPATITDLINHIDRLETLLAWVDPEPQPTDGP